MYYIEQTAASISSQVPRGLRGSFVSSLHNIIFKSFHLNFVLWRLLQSNQLSISDVNISRKKIQEHLNNNKDRLDMHSNQRHLRA